MSNLTVLGKIKHLSGSLLTDYRNREFDPIDGDKRITLNDVYNEFLWYLLWIEILFFSSDLLYINCMFSFSTCAAFNVFFFEWLSSFSMFASFLLGFLAEVQNKNVSVIIINQCEHLTIQLQVRIKKCVLGWLKIIFVCLV